MMWNWEICTDKFFIRNAQSENTNLRLSLTVCSSESAFVLLSFLKLSFVSLCSLV